MRLTCNFYVSGKSKQAESIEFHGDQSSLYLESWFGADCRLEKADFGESNYQSLPLAQEPTSHIDWSRGIKDFVAAIQENRVSRVTGAQAAHIVEILEAANISAKSGRPVDLHSTFEPPAPMDWAK